MILYMYFMSFYVILYVFIFVCFVYVILYVSDLNCIVQYIVCCWWSFPGGLRLSNPDLVEYWFGLACRLAFPSELKLKLLPARIGRLRVGFIYHFVREIQLSMNY